MASSSSSFQTILLVVFGALFAAGVMVFALATAGKQNASIGTVVIWGTFNQGTMDVVLRQAVDVNKDLDSVKYIQKDAATYRTTLTEALANGTGPDLFFITEDQAVQDGGKASHIPAANISATQFQNTFIDAAAPFYTTDGVIALPILADPLVLYWNRDLMAAGGYATPPQYWDEIPLIAQHVTKYDEAHSITSAAIALGEYSNIHTAKDILATLVMQAGNPIITRDADTGKLKLAFGTEQNNSKTHVLDSLIFYTRFADPSDPSYGWSRALPEARDAFAQAKVALYIGHASDRSLIAATNPNLNFSMAPIPQIRSLATPLDTSRVYALALSRGSTNPSGALTAAYLLVGGSISTPLAQAVGMAPALRTALTPQSQGVADLVYKAAIMSRSWIDPSADATSKVFQNMIESVVSGGNPPDAAVSGASDAFNAIIGI